MARKGDKTGGAALETALWEKFCPFFNGRCRPDCMLLARIEGWAVEGDFNSYGCGLVVSGVHPNVVEVRNPIVVEVRNQ